MATAVGGVRVVGGFCDYLPQFEDLFGANGAGELGGKMLQC